MSDIGMTAAPRFSFDFLRLNERAVLGVLSVVAGLVLWELVYRFSLVNPILISSPSLIFNAFWQLVASGELERHLTVSGSEFIVGLALAILIGLPLSILAGWYTRLGWFMQPLMAATYAAPTVALFPLIIIFLGIGFWDKVLLVFISGFLQLFIAITVGIRATEERWLRLARRRSLVNVVVAEMLAAELGLGYMIAYYGNTFKVANVFVALAIVAVAGVIFDQLFVLVENRLMRWRPAIS